MQPLAARTPGASYDRIQHFLTYSPWDPEATYDSVIETMAEEVSSEDAGLLIDDSGLPKKGTSSVGVSRQYCGASNGGIDNCQVAVTCVCAVPGTPRNADLVTWSVGMELYVPQAWIQDPQRCQKVGIPAEVTFQTKTELALKLVQKARRFGIPHRFVGADAFYGDSGPLRAQLRQWDEPYVVGVTASELRVVPATAVVHPAGTKGRTRGRFHQHPWLDPETLTVSPVALAGQVRRWQTVVWGQGTKGPLSDQFARLKVRVCKGNRQPTQEVGWLLFQRHVDEIRAFLCWGLDECSLLELVKMAHLRWGIEDVYEELKREIGWDHFEGRTWRGWHHHAVLSQMALAFLATLRVATPRQRGESYPTLPEVRREIIRRLVVTLKQTAKEGPPQEREAALKYLEELIVNAG